MITRRELVELVARASAARTMIDDIKADALEGGYAPSPLRLRHAARDYAAAVDEIMAAVTEAFDDGAAARRAS